MNFEVIKNLFKTIIIIIKLKNKKNKNLKKLY